MDSIWIRLLITVVVTLITFGIVYSALPKKTREQKKQSVNIAGLITLIAIIIITLIL